MRRLRPTQRAPEAAFDARLTVLDALPVPVAIVDAQGELVAANRAMHARAAAGSGSFAARFPEYHGALGGDLRAQREVAVTRRTNGAAVHERLVVQPAGAGAAITVLDESPMEDAQTTRLASLGFMVAGVCHEVSNPLAAIHSMVQILQSRRGASPEMLEKGLASISSNIGRLLAITRTLTDFSRVHDAPMRPVGLAQVVDEAASLVKHQTGPNAVTVDADVADDAIVLARQDRIIGVGAGQMNRVDSTRIAVMRAREVGLETRGTVCASDAFFPFRDGLDVVAGAQENTNQNIASVTAIQSGQRSAIAQNTIGLQLNVPIYAGGSVMSRTREAVGLKEKARQDLETSRRAAEFNARQSFLNVTNGMAQVRALEQALRSSNVSLQSNRVGYEVGVRIAELSLGEVFDGVLPWGLVDNRPFLRCLNGYGLCLWRLGRLDEAARVFDRILWMNPSDNQGVRFLLPAVRAAERWEDGGRNG